MPRRDGLRDDDTMGRLADIETRLDMLEHGRNRRPGINDPARVPERDERRDTEPRNRQVMVDEGEREPGVRPGMPDSMGGGERDDPVKVVDAEDRDRAERRAARAAADDKPAPKKADKKE